MISKRYTKYVHEGSCAKDPIQYSIGCEINYAINKGEDHANIFL